MAKAIEQSGDMSEPSTSSGAEFAAQTLIRAGRLRQEDVKLWIENNTYLGQNFRQVRIPYYEGMYIASLNRQLFVAETQESLAEAIKDEPNVSAASIVNMGHLIFTSSFIQDLSDK